MPLPTEPGLAALLIPSLTWAELMVIALAAVMIFGARLPEVMMQGLAHVMRARRGLARMWRETGLEDELRRVRRDIENNIPRHADFDVRSSRGRRTPSIDDPRAAAQRARERAQASSVAAADSESAYTDGGYSGPQYPGSTQGHGPEPPEYIDPDADRREPVTLQPSEEAIASGDDWRPAEASDAGAERRIAEGGTKPPAVGDADPGGQA